MLAECAQDADIQAAFAIAAGGVRARGERVGDAAPPRPPGRVTLMVDCPGHVAILAEAWAHASAASGCRAVPQLRLCIDVDMSLRVAGAHLGVHRSPCRGPVDVSAIARAAAVVPYAAVVGLMGYEVRVWNRTR